jgi:hypothetical protein
MRKIEEVETELIKMIQSIYFYPLTMANDPCCIETSLWVSHRALAFARGAEEEFQEMYLDMYHKEKANLGLYNKFKAKRPTANNQEAFKHILGKWKPITRKMGISTDARAKRRI